MQVSITAKLAAGLDCKLDAIDRISAVPFTRWDLDSLWRGEKIMRARFGAFLPNVADFDCAAFGISIPEAEFMDPQQRRLLEVRRHKHRSAIITLLCSDTSLLSMHSLSQCPCLAHFARKVLSSFGRLPLVDRCHKPRVLANEAVPVLLPVSPGICAKLVVH